MPPFVNTECKNCNKPNRFDLAELRKEDGSVLKEVVYRDEYEPEEEFAVTCEHCGRKFKFTIKGGDDGKKK